MLQLSFDFIGRHLDRLRAPRRPMRGDEPLVWKHGINVRLVRRPRARRYLLGIQPDGNARLVIPRRGTEAEALRFLARSEAWLLRRREQWRARAEARLPWLDGVKFLYRGVPTALSVAAGSGHVRLDFADQQIVTPSVLDDYRPVVEAHLRRLAEREFVLRTRELAAQHGIDVKRITVRAQKSRWGSCSSRGTISLNWRLIQTPTFVVDYLIIHELMHRREMNHSARYWKHVARAFPGYERAESWLKKSGFDLRA
jgi:predicted metal-dependent hydrolase